MKEKIEKLVNELNLASEAYYNGLDEIMTNYEWDAKFNELKKLEEETGIILENSPTQKVGAESNNTEKREKHEFPALSLDKTKNISDIIKWADNRLTVLSWKLDGLTIVATYDNGKLTKLLKRGNGIIGTNITEKASAISNLPLEIGYKGHLVVRGEAVISYSDFYRVNDAIENEDEKYKNARNLASGTLNLDDLDEIKRRNVSFVAFTPVYIENNEYTNNINLDSWLESMDYLRRLGFEIVPHTVCGTNEKIIHDIDVFTKDVPNYEYPVDGLVICYDDIPYSKTGSVTGHHATRAGYAFKWADEIANTKVTNIIYTTTRTGIISQVAEFEPVELCGTTVSRALIPNLNYRAELDIKIGDHINVYKANMIIPVIESNDDADNTRIKVINDTIRYGLPEKCPCCNEKISIHTSDSGIMNMYCNNPHCSMKQIKSIAHFADRDCMDIDGLSEKKIEFLIQHKYINSFVDLYKMIPEFRTIFDVTNEYGELLSKQEGWGEASVENLIEAIETSKNTTFLRCIHAMGIPNFGKGQAKLLAPAIIKWANENPDYGITSQDNLFIGLAAMVWDNYDFTKIEGFGPVIANSITKWVETNLVNVYYKNMPETEASELITLLNFTDNYNDYIKKDTSNSGINNKVFVITGDVNHFKNRNELKAFIEEKGGKVTGSVTGKTDYLINNDVNSTSGKNKKAKELGVNIISEEEFLTLIK